MDCPFCSHVNENHRTIKIIDDGFPCIIGIVCLECGKFCGNISEGRWRRIMAIEIVGGVERENET